MSAKPTARPPRKDRPVSARPADRHHHRISVADYNALWEAYCQDQNGERAAAAAGLGYKTALRYITGPGDPAKGFYPIAERWRQLQAERQQVEALTLTAFRQAEVNTIGRMLGVLRGEFELAAGDVRARLEAYKAARDAAAANGQPLPRGERELALDKLIASYDKLSRLGEHMLGGPDQIHALTRDPLDDLTDAEARAYIERGVVPSALRGGGVAGAQRARERGEG